MGRRFFEDGSEVVIEDFKAISSAMERGLFDRLFYELVNRTENAFFGDGFKVSYSSANSVIVKKGNGFQTDNTQVSPEPTKRHLFLASDTSKLIDSPDNTNNRIDIVVVKAQLATELTASRKKKDATTSAITTETLIVQKDWSADIQIVAGTPSGSPVAPSVPSGYVKIAELLVTAVSGLSGSGAVTDSRALMPVGSSITVDTTGKVRVTAGATTSISQLITDIDALLHRGYFNYFDIDEINSPTSEPGNPSATRQRLFYRDNVLYLKNSSGTKTPVGSGSGGGGGGANWQPVAGLGPTEDFEYDEKIWKFEQGASQGLVLWVKVPSGYIAGRKVSMTIGAYSPSASDQFKFQAIATLIKKNTTAIDSTANQNTANSGDITNTVAKQMRELSIDLSSSVGTINSVAIAAGDIIKIELSRIAPGGTEDTADLRIIPSSTEVSF